jgi:hypothetical protein
MQLTCKNLKGLGFTPSGLFHTGDTLCLHHRETPQGIEFIDGMNNNLGIFRPTPGQKRKFKDGKLSLVPPGCCAPTRKPSGILENAEILFEGEPKSKKHIKQIFNKP